MAIHSNRVIRYRRLEIHTRPHDVISQKAKIFFYYASSWEDTASVVLRLQSNENLQSDY